MVSRIATGFQNQQALDNLNKNNVAIAKTTFQVTTGFKDNSLQGFSGTSSQLLNLYDLQANAESYMTNITTASNRLKSTESSLQGMTDLLQEAAQLYTLGRTQQSASTRASLAPKAEALTNTFYNLFKTKFDGRYIFSGSNGAEPPTNATAAAAAYPGDPVPTTWYIGDSTLPSIITGSDLTQEYGVTGNEEGIAHLKAGLEALWYGLKNNSTTEIDSSIAALQSAQTEISSLIGNVGGQISSMEQLNTRHDKAITFMLEQSDNLDKVDVAEAITQFSQQQAVLEASMSIIAQTSRLSLLDFL
ncbi:MAG: flagellin [Alphaproteobacteria bacterium]